MALKTKLIDGYKVPIIPNIHQKVYRAASKPGALDMSTWHSCKTTHCRAGWVVTLAGIHGERMEISLGTDLAARRIYRVSGYRNYSQINFCESERDSLADMKRLANQEGARNRKRKKR